MLLEAICCIFSEDYKGTTPTSTEETQAVAATGRPGEGEPGEVYATGVLLSV